MGQGYLDHYAAAAFFFDASSAGVIIHTPEQPLYVNATWAQIHGYTRNEVRAMDSVIGLVAPEERQRIIDYGTARLAGRPAPNRYRYRALRRDGSTIYMEIFVQVLDWGGRTAIQSTIVDVLDQELAQQAEDSHRRLVGTMEGAFDACALWDSEERLISCNQSFRELYPELRELLVPGADFETLLRHRIKHGKIKEAIDRAEEWLAERLQRFRNPGEAFDMQLGDGRWMQIRDRRLSDGSVLLATADITERKQAEQELAAYRDELEGLVAERTREVNAQKEQLETALMAERELNGLQRQFVAMVSHEFRTPLTIVDLTSQRVVRRLDKMTRTQISEHLEATRVAIRRLTDLVDSVLSAAHLDDGRITLEPEPCDLRQLLAELAESYVERYPGHRLITRLDHLTAPITADPKLLGRVFSNIIGNAIKYAAESTVVTIEGVTTADSGAAVTIRDEGPGIPDNEVDRIFERFYRASSSTGIAGSGIGLHLARHFVELHGGTIKVETKVGQGSAFRVCLPPASAKHPHAETADQNAATAA